MKVLVVDDMRGARMMLCRILEQMDGVEVAGEPSDGFEALDYLQNNTVDLLFLDIEMPEIGGIELAEKLAEIEHKPMVVFVTAYEQYAMKAWKLDAFGYLTKPFAREDIEKVIEKYRKRKGNEEDREVRIECFPDFGLFVNGNALEIKNKKSQEILAYLVHNRGRWVSNNEICYYVFENLEETKAQNSFRSYLSRLKKMLEENHIGQILVRSYGKCKVDRSFFTCDYYDYLKGKKELFTGFYLQSYSWAEETLAEMLKIRTLS